VGNNNDPALLRHRPSLLVPFLAHRISVMAPLVVPAFMPTSVAPLLVALPAPLMPLGMVSPPPVPVTGRGHARDGPGHVATIHPAKLGPRGAGAVPAVSATAPVPATAEVDLFGGSVHHRHAGRDLDYRRRLGGRSADVDVELTGVQSILPRRAMPADGWARAANCRSDRANVSKKMSLFMVKD